MKGQPGGIFGRRRHLFSLGALSLALTFAVIWQPFYVFACALTGAQAYQAFAPEVSLAMERAALAQLGPNYPLLPSLEMGYPQSRLVAAPTPCVLLKAIGYVEGSWRQAAGSVPEGVVGPVKQSASCGYGIMQITSGMRNPGELPQETQQRIAEDYRFNIGWGARVLADKWNAGDFLNTVVGDRDPSVGEHWYYAVWAYNQFTFKNNPNNPDYPWPRPAFDGSQNRTHYPYQELVWGFAAHPPLREGKPLWESVALTLPRREDIGLTPGPLPAPPVVHSPACRTLYADPGSISWDLAPGASPAAQSIILHSAAGPGPVPWSAAVSGGSWLTVVPGTGAALPAQVTFTVNPLGLSPGTYRATVTFAGQEGATPATISVELRVRGANLRFLPYLPRRALAAGGRTSDTGLRLIEPEGPLP